MPRVLVQSATLVGAVVILLGVALGLTSYLVDAQIPEALVDLGADALPLAVDASCSRSTALLLVLGSVFEIYAAIIVLAPLVAPLGQVFNVDPVHLGVVFLANLELGFLFPPMGLNLFLSASRFGKPLPYLYRKSFVFLVILAVGVLAITYLPVLTTGHGGTPWRILKTWVRPKNSVRSTMGVIAHTCFKGSDRNGVLKNR